MELLFTSRIFLIHIFIYLEDNDQKPMKFDLENVLMTY